MTYKEFFRWCEDRALDGCWGYRTAVACLNVHRIIRETPFWKRKKVWDGYEREIVKLYINPTNEKIEQIEQDEEITMTDRVEIERLEFDRDAALAKVPKWISVEERLPEYKTAVLGYGLRYRKYPDTDPFPDVHVVYSRGEDEGWFTFWNNEYVAVTHWMPLPESPKEANA